MVPLVLESCGFCPVLQRKRRNVVASKARRVLEDDDEVNNSNSNWSSSAIDTCSRRAALNSMLALSSVPLLLSNQVAFADDTTLEVGSTLLGLDSLKDLPPFDPSTTVRVFLSRHGETENNRLKKIQGARIDAPINEMGKKQAELLGQALARTNVPPELVLHSPLQRAQQTAAIAADQLSAKPPLRELNSLRELDFGPVAEGEPVELMRAKTVATYAAWAAGDLDARMAGGGESGREVSFIFRYSVARE